MKFSGELAVSSDPNILQYIAAEPNTKIVFVGDPAGYENMIRSYGMIMATPLVPDYNVLEAEINGNMAEFQTKYDMYLSSEPAVMYFATIMTALLLGKNILLFFPPETQGLNYPNVLLSHIFVRYGIQTRTQTLPFKYNDNLTPSNTAIMYQYNTISPQIYLKLAGDSFVAMIPKLVFDLNIPIRDQYDYSSKELYNYINEYRNSLLNTDQLLVKPFTREVCGNASSN